MNPLPSSCSRTECGETGKCPISFGACPGICLYSIILHNLEIGIIVLDNSRRKVEFRNEAARQIIGDFVEVSEFDSILSFLSGKTKDSQGYGKGLQAQPCVVHIGDRLVGCTVYPIKDGEYLWIFISDITEKKRYESIAATVNAFENIGFIFSGIRHELGNPVNSTKMTLSALRAQLDTFSRPAVEEYLDRALEELGRVEYLLRSLKSVNMFERPVPERVDMTAFCDHFSHLVQNDYRVMGIRLERRIADPPLLAFVDPRHLQQVLLNLFTNSADALSDVVDPWIRTEVFAKNGLIWIKVSDNGSGISAENIGKIFTPFFTTKIKGNGLGLLLSQKMLADMNCTIDVESRGRNMGTTFTITIPEADNDKT